MSVGIVRLRGNLRQPRERQRSLRRVRSRVRPWNGLCQQRMRRQMPYRITAVLRHLCPDRKRQPQLRHLQQPLRDS